MGRRRARCTLHGLIWVRRSSRPFAWKRDVTETENWNERRARDAEGFYLERSLRGDWPHYFGPLRERERRSRQRKGENVKERRRRSGFHQHNYKLPQLSPPSSSFRPHSTFFVNSFLCLILFPPAGRQTSKLNVNRTWQKTFDIKQSDTEKLNHEETNLLNPETSVFVLQLYKLSGQQEQLADPKYTQFTSSKRRRGQK